MKAKNVQHVFFNNAVITSSEFPQYVKVSLLPSSLFPGVSKIPERIISKQ